MTTPTNSAGPTVYPAVNALLAELIREGRGILGPELVGVYLYGSLSLGDFDPASSDVDFLAVTRDTLSSGALAALEAMHARFAMSMLPYSDKLEGWYFTRAALRRPAPDEPQQATSGADWPFGLQAPGAVWVIERHIVREHGLTVFGPPPHELIDPVATEALRAATRTLLRDFWALQLDGPDWLRTRDYQAFAILTMCRALHTLHTGQVVSKPVAATWAQRHLAPPWPALITQGLAWRHDHREDDMTAMLAFVRWAVARAAGADDTRPDSRVIGDG